jgi:hypothetical protein
MRDLLPYAPVVVLGFLAGGKFAVGSVCALIGGGTAALVQWLVVRK